jgi:hypothetical protein
MTAVHDIDARQQKLGFRHTILKLLINQVLPADSEFEEAWQVYENALGQFKDSDSAMKILRGLPEISHDAIVKFDAEYNSAAMFLSSAIAVV